MMKKVLIMQTCDGINMKEMLDYSEKIARIYAKKHNHDYLRYDGIKRGFKGHHAAFNRIYLLEEQLNNGVCDWVLFMDADTIFVDLDKKLDKYLMDGYAIVACSGGDANYWNINNGVFFCNMRHPEIPNILRKWREMYESIPIEVLQGESGDLFYELADHVNDQTMLHNILYEYQNSNICYNFHSERQYEFNYYGPFIQQILRTNTNNLQERTRIMKEKMTQVLSRYNRGYNTLWIILIFMMVLFFVFYIINTKFQ